MDFYSVEQEFANLKARFQRGALTEPDFRARLEELMIQDEQGRWWIIGYETGEWYVHDGKNWVRQDPPRAAPVRSMETAAVPHYAPSAERQYAYPGAAPFDMKKEEARRTATMGLIFSILGMVTCALVMSPVGIVQARKAKKVLVKGDRGYGEASAAEIIGWIGLALWILGIIITVVMVLVIGSDPYYY